jgi:hypothetical protein
MPNVALLNLHQLRYKFIGQQCNRVATLVWGFGAVAQKECLSLRFFSATLKSICVLHLDFESSKLIIDKMTFKREHVEPQ